MKKFFGLFLAALAAIALCSCSNQASAQSAELGSEPVTITFWHSASDEAGVLVDKYVKEFNETNDKQITVEAVYQGQYSDAATLMKTVISAENYSELPNIMQLDATGKVDYYNSGRALTIDEAQEQFGETITDGIFDTVLANWQYSGAQLGMPFATSTTITYCNMDLLAQAGWSECPTSFTDIIKLSADMKAAGIEAAAYGTVPNTPTLANWLGQMGSYLVNNKNGTDGMATALDCVDNGALRDFLAAWKEMYDAGAVENTSLSTNQFVAGEVAVFTSSSSNLASVLSKVDGAFEVGVANFIRVNDDVPYGATASGSCLVLFKDDENELKEQAAWEFLKYMISDAVQCDFAAGTGYTVAKPSETWDAFIADGHEQYDTGRQQLSITSPEMRSVTVGPSVDFYNAIMSGVGAMLENGTDPDTAAAELADTLQGLLDNWARMNG